MSSSACAVSERERTPSGYWKLYALCAASGAPSLPRKASWRCATNPSCSARWTSSARCASRATWPACSEVAYLGVYFFRLETPWADSLKEKRSAVTPVVERLRSRFPVSVARLEGQNRHDWEVIGVTTIAQDPLWVRETLDRVARFLIGGAVPVRELRREVLELTPQADEPASREG